MVIVLKKGKPINELIKKLNVLMSTKHRGLQTSKYSGKIKFDKDPLEIQESLRNEWG